jgi:hypothetical protein
LAHFSSLLTKKIQPTTFAENHLEAQHFFSCSERKGERTGKELLSFLYLFGGTEFPQQLGLI